MIQIYKTQPDGALEQLSSIEQGAWIHLLDPNEEELMTVQDALHVEPEFLRAALDEEETVRIETDEGQTLVVVDIPVVKPERSSFLYTTIPLAIVLVDHNIITVCLEETSILEDFWNKRVRGFDTCKRSRFLLQILYRNASKYLQYLRQIDKAETQVEDALHESMKNRELIQMLKLEKSLVFFSTSLKANEVVLEKMMKFNLIKRYPDDVDLLEDVIIENKQAIEMGNIYRDILSGTMDAFASVISNNLNIVMKLLASLTIVLSIPTLVASLWGMNVPVPFADNPNGFWLVLSISVVASAVSFYVLWKKKMF